MSFEYSGFAKLDVRRITALWAFSEAAFGGVLHALKIPLTGLFIGGAAVIFITLLANASKDKSVILRSTLIVILIKAVISPHSPITAYFAVTLQGVLGYLLFSFIKFEKAAAVLLALFTMTFSSMQKLIVLTVLFGTTIWNSIDLFVEFILAQVGFKETTHNLSFSLTLILIYVSIHIAAGIFIGIRAARLKEWLKNKSTDSKFHYISTYISEDLFINNNSKKKKKKMWWQRPTGILLLLFSIALIFISYATPAFNKNTSLEILIMIIRSMVITFIWFSVISPIILKHFSKLVESKKFRYASEINQITSLFPGFKLIINHCWVESAKLKGVERIKYFLSDSLALLLTVDFKDEKTLYPNSAD